MLSEEFATKKTAKVLKWPKVKLEEVATTSSGEHQVEQRANIGVAVFLGLSRDNCAMILSKTVMNFISESGLKNSSASIVKQGTLLIALYGATAGKLGFADINAATNQAVCAIISDENILNKTYLFTTYFR